MTTIPAHADLTDPAEAEWWGRWAAVGDAKNTAREARDAVVAAEKRYGLCRTEAVDPGPGECGCGHCLDRYREARTAHDTAVDAVRAAEQKFKEG